jgi:hypothetical protein
LSKEVFRTPGFLWLAYIEEIFEMGVHRAIRLLEQASPAESIISAEEGWVEGVTANGGRLDEVLPTIYSGFLENAGRDPNIAHELYKQGLMKKPVGLQSTSHRTAREDSWYSFKTS